MERGSGLSCLLEGPGLLVRAHGIGTAEDLEHTESHGCLPGAEPSSVSERARVRGAGQVGTIGSGNHFIEVQHVDQIFDGEAAAAFALREGSDHGPDPLRLPRSRSPGMHRPREGDGRRDRPVRDPAPRRQLACAPQSSPEGRRYLGAMAAAANFAFANRHAMAQEVREAARRILGAAVADGARQVYDVAHNVAKIERHGGRDLCVHRKGATRAFPAGSPEIPERYRAVRQPVFIPGSMGTASYVLVGLPGSLELSFGSACHGAGRRMSRTGARKRIGGA